MVRGLLLLALVRRTAADPGASLQIDAAVTHSGDCALTDQDAKKPRYLKFCQDYNNNACCIPGHDLENQLQFELLIDGLGPGCKNPMMYPNIRYYYCLGCDPKQAEYTEYNPNYDGEGSMGYVYVCEDFVKKLWTDYIPQYRECGVMQANACPEPFGDFDPYTCGDDLVIPPVIFGESLGPAGTEAASTADDCVDGGWECPDGKMRCGGIGFMNQYPPPGMYDYTFVIANESSKACWQPPFMRSSAARVLSGGATLAVMLLGVALRHFL